MKARSKPKQRVHFLAFFFFSPQENDLMRGSLTRNLPLQLQSRSTLMVQPPGLAFSLASQLCVGWAPASRNQELSPSASTETRPLWTWKRHHFLCATHERDTLLLHYYIGWTKYSWIKLQNIPVKDKVWTVIKVCCCDIL